MVAVAVTALGLASFGAVQAREEVGVDGTFARGVVVVQTSVAADTVEGLYRQAWELLDRGRHMEAARRFATVAERYPDSGHAPEALYWSAFALYREGGEDRLEAALEALARHRDRYPEAAGRQDAEALEARIEGLLARLGDADAARRVTERAVEAASEGMAVQMRAEAMMQRSERVSRIPTSTAMGRSTGGMGGGAVQEACPDEEDDVRTAALNALLHMDSERALPLLRKVLEQRGPCTVELRKRAVFLVSQHDGPETGEILLDVVRNDPDLEVRERAVFWLSEVDDERAVDFLQEVLAGESETVLQEKALFALSEHDSPRAGEILRDYALDPRRPEPLRQKAIFWIGQRDDEDAGEFLRTLYGRLESPELRERVLFAVAEADGADNGTWLLERARDPSEPVELRKKALFWAAEAEVPIQRMRALFTELQERELREQVLFALTQYDEEEAVGALIEIARSEEDRELRKKAIFWLGQTDDPRAADFLMELIEELPGEGGEQ
ncbi:MAG: HEAT repeat domain-containing protein [Gemmatimonadota bacterium]|nr:HEAT repeat domain-containing protein [Gemmatimonadota bacterium]